ncbi:MAG: C39 family peptidase [Patescibacteria group bacterium]|nr:C39 family peptidase [Patescibacteria group bacterium]
MKKIVIAIFAVFLLSVAFLYRVEIRQWYENRTREVVPSPRSAEEFSYPEENGAFANVLPDAASMTASGGLPDEFNLDVPFTSQAPLKEWDETHEESCEEASVIMVDYFYKNNQFTSPEQADEAILKFIDYEKTFLGFFESTTADELARVVESYYDYDVDLIYDFSVDNVKQAVRRGYPVIVPAAGRVLDNPHFQDPGPIYHMLVIKGWKGDSFITNDPGTQFGADWLYTFDHLMESAHDWNGGNVEQGKRVMLIVKPRVNN